MVIIDILQYCIYTLLLDVCLHWFLFVLMITVSNPFEQPFWRTQLVNLTTLHAWHLQQLSAWFWLVVLFFQFYFISNKYNIEFQFAIIFIYVLLSKTSMQWDKYIVTTVKFYSGWNSRCCVPTFYNKPATSDGGIPF